jgi:hypothetical protein
LELKEFTEIEGQPFIEYSLKTKKLLTDKIALLETALRDQQTGLQERLEAGLRDVNLSV